MFITGKLEREAKQRENKVTSTLDTQRYPLSTYRYRMIFQMYIHFFLNILF